jgi:CRISPR-associated protein Csd2
MNKWEDLIPVSINEKYEIHNINHAVEIITQAYPLEFTELTNALDAFKLSVKDIIQGGGNESAIPKKLSEYLHPLNWNEIKISADLLIKLHHRNPQKIEERTIYNFIDGHNIDYVKGKVALDLEWNSKDQTFDRDLYAFRAFYECGVISCGIIITRSASLNKVFISLGKEISKKYGASTTWMGKLMPRINSGRHGGCPLIIIGITPKVITDIEEINSAIV